MAGPGQSTKQPRQATNAGLNKAQIDPRSIGPVLLGAGGPTGPYFDRFGLRYYREAYPGTECSLWGDDVACTELGDYHIDDVYFPDPEKLWL